MDKEDLENLIAEYHSRLPQRLQQVFSSLGWIETLKSIGDRYKLDESQMNDLSIETTMLMLGATHWNDYAKHLFDVMRLPQSKLDEILGEIKTFIYGPIESELSDAYYINAIILEELQKNMVEEESKLVEAGLDERFKKLDPRIQKIVQDSNYQVKIYSIGKRNNLTFAQITELEEVITETILGNISIDRFEEELKKRANLPEERLGFIMGEVNEKILREIRSSILSLSRKTETPTNISSPTEHPNHSISNRLNISIEAEKKLAPIEAESVKTTEPTNQTTKVDEPKASIIAAKIQDSFATPKVTTEYTLGKISKDSEKKEMDSKKWSDPYRVDPNE